MRRCAHLTVRDLGSEMILYDQTSETFHVLNTTARQIWLWVEDDGVAQKLMGLFPQVDPDRIQQDVVRTIDAFDRMGLVER